MLDSLFENEALRTEFFLNLFIKKRPMSNRAPEYILECFVVFFTNQSMSLRAMLIFPGMRGKVCHGLGFDEGGNSVLYLVKILSAS